MMPRVLRIRSSVSCRAASTRTGTERSLLGLLLQHAGFIYGKVCYTGQCSACVSPMHGLACSSSVIADLGQFSWISRAAASHAVTKPGKRRAYAQALSVPYPCGFWQGTCSKMRRG